MTTELDVARARAEREQAETLAQIANELALLNKTLKLIAESLRAIVQRLP
jgi:hypothetical protein